MSGIDNIRAATISGEAHKRPVIIDGPERDERADGVIVDEKDLGSATRQAVFCRVQNPFGRSARTGLDLNALLKESPSEGEQAIQQLAAEVRTEIDRVLNSGADGICYMLSGACAAECSPMQYGGHFLEVDREILAGTPEGSFNILYVCGERELYIDIVSDLPAQAIAWNSSAGVQVSEVREMWPRAVAAADQDADIYMVERYESALQWIQATEATRS
ncbi:MAG: hypothetical protein IH944_10495 [Armatimonadetes bacterium]|nr:hypothetical protein [Armatimonadota bacterium]